MQGLVPKYLEQAMSVFAQQQEQVRATMQKTMGTLFPFGNMEEVTRQNRAMMERAFSMFTPFYRGNETPPSQPDAASQEIANLRAEVERLRRELANAKAGKGK
jgi:polyhydroxyalkanoate synthesis regulator protein